MEYEVNEHAAYGIRSHLPVTIDEVERLLHLEGSTDRLRSSLRSDSRSQLSNSMKSTIMSSCAFTSATSPNSSTRMKMGMMSSMLLSSTYSQPYLPSHTSTLLLCAVLVDQRLED